jgi:hypothetical protein
VSLLSGSWGFTEGEDTCSANPHEISFSQDRMFLDVQTRVPIEGARGRTESEFRYRILSYTGSSIRLELEGETRKTKAGEPVVWDLILRGSDEYCWQRSDWPRGACTKPVVRCR